MRGSDSPGLAAFLRVGLVAIQMCDFGKGYVGFTQYVSLWIIPREKRTFFLAPHFCFDHI